MKPLHLLELIALYAVTWGIVLLAVLAFLGGCRGVEPWLP